MFAGVAEVDEEIAEEQAEPANLDGDVFRREFPAREFGVHAVIIANASAELPRCSRLARHGKDQVHAFVCRHYNWNVTGVTYWRKTCLPQRYDENSKRRS